jgi:hypothetical protein
MVHDVLRKVALGVAICSLVTGTTLAVLALGDQAWSTLTVTVAREDTDDYVFSGTLTLRGIELCPTAPMMIGQGCRFTPWAAVLSVNPMFPSYPSPNASAVDVVAAEQIPALVESSILLQLFAVLLVATSVGVGGAYRHARVGALLINALSCVLTLSGAATLMAATGTWATMCDALKQPVDARVASISTKSVELTMLTGFGLAATSAALAALAGLASGVNAILQWRALAPDRHPQHTVMTSPFSGVHVRPAFVLVIGAGLVAIGLQIAASASNHWIETNVVGSAAGSSLGLFGVTACGIFFEESAIKYCVDYPYPVVTSGTGIDRGKAFFLTMSTAGPFVFVLQLIGVMSITMLLVGYGYRALSLRVPDFLFKHATKGGFAAPLNVAVVLAIVIFTIADMYAKFLEDVSIQTGWSTWLGFSASVINIIMLNRWVKFTKSEQEHRHDAPTNAGFQPLNDADSTDEDGISVSVVSLDADTDLDD